MRQAVYSTLIFIHRSVKTQNRYAHVAPERTTYAICHQHQDFRHQRILTPYQGLTTVSTIIAGALAFVS